MTPKSELQICLDSYESAVAAQDGGADSIELCAHLEDGGTTPSAGLIQSVCEKVEIPVHVLLRPRGGDFYYSPYELEIIVKDIEFCKKVSAQGVVIGMLTQEGEIDLGALERLTLLAKPLAVTFHRAFDVCLDPFKALQQLKDCRVDRLLTSGWTKSVSLGQENLKRFQEIAGDELFILAGSGVNKENIQPLMRDTGIKGMHIGGSCRTKKVEPFGEIEANRLELLKEFGCPDEGFLRSRTSADLVREFKKLMN